MNIKEEIIEALTELHPEVEDFEAIDQLVHGKTLDSLDIVTLISDLCERFDIEISPQEITYENFDTVEGLVAMVIRLQNN